MADIINHPSAMTDQAKARHAIRAVQDHHKLRQFIQISSGLEAIHAILNRRALSMSVCASKVLLRENLEKSEVTEMGAYLHISATELSNMLDVLVTHIQQVKSMTKATQEGDVNVSYVVMSAEDFFEPEEPDPQPAA